MLSVVENAKNLFRLPELKSEPDPEYVPYILLEARIDFSDIRTGFRKSYNLHQVVSIPQQGNDPIWDDMVAGDIDPKLLASDPPEAASFRSLPGHVDRGFISWMETRYLQHLLQSFAARVYRNYYLGVYSASGESMADFIIRCIDLIQKPMYSEFDSMLEVFRRKLERLQQKYMGKENSENLDAMKMDSRHRELFHHISERIAALFLRTEFSIQRVARPTGPVPHLHELEERLQALHFEAQETVTRILDFYEEKVKSVDEYILHPTLKDFHFVRSFVLWMPAEAAADGR